MFDPLVFKKIELLLAARKRIETESCSFLCVALDRAVQYEFDERLNFGVYSQASEELQGEITKAFTAVGIDGVASVFSWLLKTGAISNDEDVTEEQLREYRLLWIDSWIAELKESNNVKR